MTRSERIVRASAGRRPGRVLGRRRRARRDRHCGWRCGWSRARRPTRSSAAAPTRFQATERYPRDGSATHSVIVLVRGELSEPAADVQPRAG
jgi:hypothetical protein